jgi:ABC-type multidrug transport system fused ATPase/permease subunit
LIVAAPEGVSRLFSAKTRKKLWLALIGSIVVAVAEVAGISAVLPLMQLITGASADEGALGLVNSLLGHPSESTVAIFVACTIFIAFLAKGLFTIWFRWWLIGFVAEQERETAIELLRRYLAAPYWLHLQRNTAELVRTMNDAVGQTYSMVVVGAISAVTELITVVAVGAALVILMPGPALLLLLYFGVAGLVLQQSIKRKATNAGEVMAHASFQMYQAAFQALGGVKEITVRQNAEHFLSAYRSARNGYVKARRTSAFLNEFPRYVLELVFIVGIALLTVVVFSSSPSEQALSMLALFVAAGFRLLPSMVRAVASINAIRIGRKSISLVLADLSTELDPAQGPTSEGRFTWHDAIRIDDLSFAYSSDSTDVLHRISLDIPAGSSLALVGASGAGKSTLVDLLLGLHTPRSGRITVDGWDIQEDISLWQRSLGLVPQDIYLMDDTIASNIAFGESAAKIDQERLSAAVTKAQLDELLPVLPEGLDTMVGERGVRLSGGQRQRIGIARALYLQPQLVILDEATSALDNETERRITDTIESLHGEMTIVVVAHRLSTIRNCDRVLFLKDGEIEASGTFDEVEAQSPDFASLVALASLRPAAAAPVGES